MRDERGTPPSRNWLRDERGTPPGRDWLTHEVDGAGDPYAEQRPPAAGRTARRAVPQQPERSVERPRGTAHNPALLSLPPVPAVPAVPTAQPPGADRADRSWSADGWGDFAGADWDADDAGDDGDVSDSWYLQPDATAYPQSTTARSRAASAARPLARLDERYTDAPHGLRAASIPDVAAYPIPTRHQLRRRADARADARANAAGTRIRKPWPLLRLGLVLLALCVGLTYSVAAISTSSTPLVGAFRSQAGTAPAVPVTDRVRPETQGMRPDLYDSTQQFNDWWDAACSAAVLSEVLTGWGVQQVSIGRMIDELGPDISMNGGLLSFDGFERAAAKHSYRADLASNLTYNQMLYITTHLKLPLIVNVRMASGYYHFFSGGHFLVMTGGDAQGLQIVDSSEYYIKYLTREVFASMFTGRTVLIVPRGYQYTLPSS